MKHYLVIHVDTSDKLDIAEVRALNILDAATIVQSYPDTEAVISAIESDQPLTGIRYHLLRDYQGVLMAGPLLPTEGNDLPEEQPAQEQPVVN